MKVIKRGFLLLIVLLTAGIILLSAKDREQSVSVYENRSLATRPVFSLQRMWDGSYSRDWDAYISDHVYRRDDQMRAYQWLRLFCKRAGISNNVVITDDALLPFLPAYDYSGIDNDENARNAVARLANIQQQAEADGALFLYVGIDEQRTALSDRYPPYLRSRCEHYEAQNEAFRRACAEGGIHTLFLRDVLDHNVDPITYYSAVDHHFNFYGAYQAYRAICDTLASQLPDFPIAEESELGVYQLPDTFFGSYSRRLYDLSPVQEQLAVFDASILPAFERWDNGVRTDAPVLALPKDGEKVQYTIFMGGDQGETVIQTHRPELPSILIVGDSFTNPIEALCVYSFDEVRSLDYRYYTEMKLSDYLALHKVDAVIVIRDNLNYTGSDGNGNLA